MENIIQGMWSRLCTRFNVSNNCFKPFSPWTEFGLFTSQIIFRLCGYLGFLPSQTFFWRVKLMIWFISCLCLKQYLFLWTGMMNAFGIRIQEEDSLLNLFTRSCKVMEITMLIGNGVGIVCSLQKCWCSIGWPDFEKFSLWIIWGKEI